MINALAPMYIAQFAEYRDVLVLKQDPRPAMPATEFLQAQTLLKCMYKFRPQYLNEDVRGLASIWSKYYFVKIIPPVVVASLVLQWELDLDIQRISVVIDANGLPLAFKLPNEGQAIINTCSSPEQRFHSLLEDNLRPFIQALSLATKLSEVVLWSNAGNFFEWILGAMQQHSIPSEVLTQGYQLLDTKFKQGSPNKEGRKQRNPLWQPVEYVTKHAQPRHRQRRMCCIRYLLPEMSLCNDCPRTSPPKNRTSTTG